MECGNGGRALQSSLGHRNILQDHQAAAASQIIRGHQRQCRLHANLDGDDSGPAAAYAQSAVKVRLAHVQSRIVSALESIQQNRPLEMAQ